MFCIALVATLALGAVFGQQITGDILGAPNNKRALWPEDWWQCGTLASRREHAIMAQNKKD